MLSVVVWFSLSLALVDAGMHSSGASVGYVLQAPQFTVQNPLDRLLVGSCHLRLDSAALTIFLLYFFLASIWGAASVGVRCFCIPCLSSHGQIRARKTMPQALLLCAVCNAFGTVYFLFQLPVMAPVYATFGCQPEAATRCALGENRSVVEGTVTTGMCAVSQLKSETMATRLGPPQRSSISVSAQQQFEIVSRACRPSVRWFCVLLGGRGVRRGRPDSGCDGLRRPPAEQPRGVRHNRVRVRRRR